MVKTLASKKVQVCLAPTVVGAIAVLLSGCDQNMAQGPVAIQRDDDALVLVFCREIQVGEVLIETWASGNGTPTITVLDAGGLRLITEREALTIDQLALGLSVATQTSPPLNPRDNLAVQLLPADSADEQINATFTIKDDGLSETLWLHPDGRESTNPCF